MTVERTGLIEFDGQDQTVVGADIELRQKAPSFVGIAQNWSEQNPMEESAGKVRIFAALPSLDTSVCDKETRRFNEEATNLGEDVYIYMISMDLPFAQKRWCAQALVDRVTTLSDHKYADFGPKYGCLIKEKRILRRAVFVVDRDDNIVYADYMKALGDEPDYAAVLSAAKGVA